MTAALILLATLALGAIAGVVLRYCLGGRKHPPFPEHSHRSPLSGRHPVHPAVEARLQRQVRDAAREVGVFGAGRVMDHPQRNATER